jgi:hypothetical protein
MSLSNIISDNDGPSPTFSKHSESRTPKSYPVHIERAPSPPPPVTPVHLQPLMPANHFTRPIINGNGIVPLAPQVNGVSPVLKAKPDPSELQLEYSRIDAVHLNDLDVPENENWATEYKGFDGKRVVGVGVGEISKRKVCLTLISFMTLC